MSFRMWFNVIFWLVFLKMMWGFLLFSFSAMRFRFLLVARMMVCLVCILSVNEMRSIAVFFVSSVFIVGPGPGMVLIMSGGKSISFVSAVSRSVESGVSLLGLIIIVQSVIRAGFSFQDV